MKKISVIIPCYNVEKYIDRCLRSMENQTCGMDNLEIILLDDASGDNTYKQLLQFEQKYPENVLVISCEQHCGPGSARNIGMQYMTGEYVSFVDADDVPDATMFQKMYDVMKTKHPDVVECAYKTFSNQDELFVETRENSFFVQIKTPQDRGQFIINSFKSAVWGRLYRKSFLEENELCFPDNIVYGEDNYFSGLLMLMCHSYYYIGETLYYYYQNPDGITNRNNDSERIWQLSDIMKLYIRELGERGFLEEELSGCGKEFEWYMIYKYFMDPVNFLISRRIEGWKEHVRRFGTELLQYFPEAYNNIYFRSDPKWRSHLLLLLDAAGYR